jgi:AcrR family transcriptional regulator
MPKLVDIAERDRIVSEAAWRVLVRDGLTELSVRKVAAEAGLPPSSLRYTFPTQASVRDRAVALLLERLEARVASHGDHQTAGPDEARAILLELLPLDNERRMEMEVSLALGAMAMTDSALWNAHHRTHVAVRQACATALTILGVDTADVSGAHAFIDGLALHLVRQPTDNTSDWAVRALDAYLRRLAPGALPDSDHHP